MYKFYSQGAEDVYIYSLLLNQKDISGVFVEIGGLDGVTFSNSKFFEDNLGYTGILIEPTENFELMKINRPKCRNYNTAIDTKEGIVEFLGNGCSAGVETLMTDSFKRFHHRNSSKHIYKACPINKIIKKEEVPYIDLFILDVEGSELKVLQTFDFSIPVYIFEIELHGDDEEKDEKCREILKEEGFTFFSRLGSNEFWVNNNYFRRSILYKKPLEIPNVFSLGEYPFVDISCGILNSADADIQEKFTAL